MGDIRIVLNTYSSDIAGRVMELTEEIPDKERQALKDFIQATLMDLGNPGVFETLARGILEQYLRNSPR